MILYRAILPDGREIVEESTSMNGALQRAMWEGGFLKKGDYVALTEFRSHVQGPQLGLLLGWRYIVNNGQIDIPVELFRED